MIDRELRLLVASDDDAAMRSGLSGAGFTGIVIEARSAAAALAAMDADAFDCVLIDDRMPAVELIRAVRDRSAAVPIVVVADADDRSTEQRLVDAGATDWLLRAELTSNQVSRRLRHVLRVARAEAVSAAALALARDATRARDEILAIVAHDLRAPLHSVRLACTELATDLPFELAARYVGAIARAAKRGDDLIGELLEIVKIDNHALRVEPRPVDIRALVRRACADHELIAKSTETRLESSMPDEPIRVLADPEWIARVLANLIGNALVHARGAAVELEVVPAVDTVTIAVVDDGRGIAADELPHVFDRFWQGRVRRGGAGLGLAIAKGIVEAHHGTITAANVPGRGARFEFTLQRAA
jgi:signal transduction histidine kinase